MASQGTETETEESHQELTDKTAEQSEVPGVLAFLVIMNGSRYCPIPSQSTD